MICINISSDLLFTLLIPLLLLKVNTVTANANPTNAVVSNISATPVGGSQILSSQGNPSQPSISSTQENGNENPGIPEDISR